MGNGAIRVGVVGASVTKGGSGWGADVHVPALQALAGYELKAVCTSREETARASAQAFGADLAFDDCAEMASHPEVDVVAVVVRVPSHRDLVMGAVGAGKPVFCEWPLGTDVAQAVEMADAARKGSVPTAVGLQGRSDPHARYARDLIAQGALGEVLAANLSVCQQARARRGTGRIWQADRAHGANPLTIAGGHSLDVLCYLIGEFAEVSSRVATLTQEWENTDTGERVEVTAPDAASVAGRLVDGAEVAVQIVSVPRLRRGRLEVHGREGSLMLTGSGLWMGPNQLFVGHGSEPMTEVRPPDDYTRAPADLEEPRSRNVAEAWIRFAEALSDGSDYDPDFDTAVQRHRLIDAIERSSEQGRTISV